jgi:predicted aspartyl protease
MIKKIFYLFLFITTNIYAQNIDLNIGETKAENYFEEFSFEFVKGKIFVPVEIGGKTYRFILDTGAPNIISKEINELINPKLLKSIPITDASGKKENLNVVSVKELKFGNILFEQTATLVYDLNSSLIFKCFGIDGFIGSNMLRNSIIQIDVEENKIRLTDDKNKLSLNKKNSSKIKLIGSQSSPYLWIKLKGLDSGKEQVLIDTGMGGLYDVSYKNYDVFKKENIFNPIGESKGASSIGLFGDVPDNTHLRLHLPILKINELELENCITTTTNDNNSRIGSELLKYGIMTIDFKNKRFYLNPKTKKINIEKLEYDFTKTIKNGKLIIGFVWDNNLKKKISYEDEIIEINEKPVSICDLISKEVVSENDKSIKLKIKPKKGEIFEIEINKKTTANTVYN